MMKWLLISAFAAAGLIGLIVSACGDDDDDDDDACDQDAMPICLNDCKEGFPDPEDVIEKDSCVYDCYSENGCDPGCLQNCIHNDCSFVDDIQEYGDCQQHCIGLC